MTEKTFLVTGAAGFIGSHSVDRLLAGGYRVVGVDNLSSGHLHNLEAALASPRFHFIQGDVCDPSVLNKAFRYGFSGVLHLAALVSVPQSFAEPALNYHSNLAATDHLARMCIRQGVRRLVFASSAAVYGDTTVLPISERVSTRPMSPYAAAKFASEVMLGGYRESFGLEGVCLRYFNIYGLRQEPGSPYSGVLSIFSQRFRQGRPVTVYGDGEQSRDFVSVEDVARINCLTLTVNSLPLGPYNVCTGRSITLNRLLDIYRGFFPDAPPAHYAEPRVGDIRNSRGDPARLLEVLGYRTRVEVEQGLHSLIRMDQVGA